MKNMQITALDAYMNRVYRLVMLITPAFGLCASATITMLHYIGWYSQINEIAMWLFVLFDVVYFLLAVYLVRTGFDEDGMLVPAKLKAGKYITIAYLIAQWNAISYIWPFTDFWAYCVLFVILEAFYFDVKMVSITTVGITASMIISWFIKGGMLLPANDEYFGANMVFRIVGIVLMLLSINIITYFGGKYLVEELEKYVNYDTLTHLLNRRSMDNYLQAAHKEAVSGQAPFCLLLMDIDDFKKVNDNYGHDCGDEVLKGVARIISTGVQKNDNVFRWGGEEILVLLKTNLDEAVAVAERIRKSIAKDPIEYSETVRVSVTVTIGVAPYTAGVSIQQMMEDADAKLYYGKKHGKNQVVCEIPN